MPPPQAASSETFGYARRVRLLLASGVVLTGIESVQSAEEWAAEHLEASGPEAWVTVVRTGREQGMVVRETLRLRAGQVIGVGVEDPRVAPQSD
jgi:hypothetical protein